MLIPLLIVTAASADSGLHPIIVQQPKTSHAAFVGASTTSGWIKAESAAARTMGGERYRLYSLAGRAGESAGGKAGPVDDTGQPYVTLKPRPASSSTLVGVAGAWSAVPRSVKKVTGSDKGTVQAVRDFLRARNLAVPTVRIKQAIRADLNGDGKSETIVVAERYDAAKNAVPDEARTGDYSVVLLITGSGARSKALRLASEVYPPVKPAAEPSPPNVRELAGVLDLNGDGKLEIVVQWQYYEGGGFDVYTFDGTRPRRVLEWSAGL